MLESAIRALRLLLGLALLAALIGAAAAWLYPPPPREPEILAPAGHPTPAPDPLTVPTIVAERASGGAADEAAPLIGPLPAIAAVLDPAARHDSLLSVHATPTGLVRSFVAAPAEICRIFAAHGLPNGGWQPDPVAPGRWSCATEIVPIPGPGAATGDAATLFGFAFGSRTGLDVLRLKIDRRGGEAGAALAAARAIFADVHALAGWAMPSSAAAALASLAPAETQFLGMELDVAPEPRDPDQINIVFFPAARAEPPPARAFRAPPQAAEPSSAPAIDAGASA